MSTTTLATFAGGCFWCLEAAFKSVRGVTQVTSGYMGGHVPAPTYEQVCQGDTGHAEVVQIAFDPDQISYRELLEIFFALHDPTQLNRQGDDIGSQYRSAIFYHSENQRQQAADIIAEMTRDNIWPEPIVTELAPASTFYPAEDYHQGYADNNPDNAYCAAVVQPKLAKFRQTFATKLKS